MTTADINRAEAAYANCFIRLQQVERYALTCSGCGCSMPVGAFYFRGQQALLCVDCGKSIQTLFRKLSLKQISSSRSVWFKDPKDYVDVYRVRAIPALKLFEVKLSARSGWVETTEEYFLHCVTHRGYRKHSHESYEGHDVYHQTEIKNEQP